MKIIISVLRNVCRYCDFHVKAAYYSASSSRPGFTSSSFPRTGHGRGRGGRAAPYPSVFSQQTAHYSLNRPASMPINRDQDKSFPCDSQTPPQRVALSKAKLTSSGYVMESSSLTLSSSASGVSKSQLSKSENILASRLSRPSRGSLNLLRHLEALSDDKSKSNNSALRSRSLKTLLPSGSDGTFASFFADAKKKVQEKAAGPQLCRGIDPASENDNFIDLGPISTSNPTHTGALTVLPSINGARRRIEALVRSKGGVEALDRLERERTQKRLSEVVSRSASKRPRPSPLSQVLDTAPPPSGNVDPEETHRDEEKAASEKRRHANHELAQLVSQGSSHSDLAAADEVLAEKRLLSRLEARDSIEEHLLGQHEQECQVVTCLTCNYRSLRAGRLCRKEGHRLEITTATRRFFACRNCKTRTSTLDRYPQYACTSCGESLYEKTGAISERRGPKLPGEKLLIRGLEEKYLG
uniref:Protein MCM10 homolog n=1 Tax=Mesocestoides corti TaxID=53468 RepID=A0A5K3FSN2_MESCO